MTSTNPGSRVAVVLACLIGGATGRVSAAFFETLLAGAIPHVVAGPVSSMASGVATAAVGWFTYGLIVRWTDELEREWERNRQRRGDDLNPPAN